MCRAVAVAHERRRVGVDPHAGREFGGLTCQRIERSEPESCVKVWESYPEPVDSVDSILPGCLPGATGGKNQPGAVLGATELSWHQQDTVAQGLERSVLERWREAEPLEPVDQVVREQEQVKVRLVGEEVTGRDTAHRVVALILALILSPDPRRVTLS